MAKISKIQVRLKLRKERIKEINRLEQELTRIVHNPLYATEKNAKLFIKAINLKKAIAKLKG